MKLRAVFQAALALGAALAVVGGAAIAVLHLVQPDLAMLKPLEAAYRHIVFGFLFLTLFAVASALLEALAPAPPRVPAAAPVAPPTADAPAPSPPPDRLSGLYHEMKIYVDLEMWELALEKASQIVKEHPATKEAELVSRNLNELRWKAEPKFVSQGRPMSADQEKQFREKGLAQMYQHVKTYMDLEMWELARQKAVAIMKSFPDSPESAELIKVFETIQRKAAEAVGSDAPAGSGGFSP